MEIHSANDYLLDQFLREGTNRRSDQYGGDINKRLRLLDEVVSVVGDENGYTDYPTL